MSYFSKFPKRITEEVEITINPSSLDGNATLATRFISTCNHCGLCKEVCPKDIDMGEFLMRSHRTMHEKGKMPWAFHEFYLRDMEFSNTEAALSKVPDGFEQSTYMFFPGCQLGASDPKYVSRSYQYLKECFPDTALMLSCCGAPAEWAGDEAIHKQVIGNIKADWIRMGKPTAIFACPMCKKMFDRYLPEVEGLFLYNIMNEKKIRPSRHSPKETVSIFDPCASRTEPDLQNTIRELARTSGFVLEPLPRERKLAECCSYGGQVAITYPPYASHVVKNRIEQNDNSYITYCSNCRDIFAAAGKKTMHILDVVFGIEKEDHKPPTVSARRENRMLLKQQMLTMFWKEEGTMGKPEKEFIIPQQLREKLNREMILETDIYAVIEKCEQSGKKVFDPDAETFSGHIRIGNMTYWVEYKITGNYGYELVNAYSHRMKIEEK
jgi:Fe-S oxidoreductase